MSATSAQKPTELIEKAQRLEARYTLLQEQLKASRSEYQRLCADAMTTFGIASIKDLKPYRDNIEQQRVEAQQALFDAVSQATGILDKLDSDLAKINSRA